MPIIAADCGGTTLAVMRLERAGDPGEPIVGPSPPLTEDIPFAIAEIAERLGGGDAAGVALAGLVAGGDLVWTPHRDRGAPIAGPLSEAIGGPVVVDNDANCAALGEATLGAGVGHRVVLMVTVGTGIGGGLIIEGEVERARGHLGEIGHVAIADDGPTCSCGQRGCWEAFASGTALDRAARRIADLDPKGAVAVEAGTAAPAGPHLVAAAARGDPRSGEALEDVAMQFGRGLANMVAVFDPDVIVVGGGLGSIGEPLLGPARREMAARLSGAAHRRPTPVVPAALGTRSGLVGAALLAGAPT